MKCFLRRVGANQLVRSLSSTFISLSRKAGAKMAPVVVATASSAKRGRKAQSHEVVAGDRQPLKKPLSTRARTSITKQTTRLIERRDQLQAQLMRDFERRFRRQPLRDKIPRRELRRLTKVLIRREKQYLGAMNKILEEKERLHRQDPSFERSIDLNLVKTQLQRFERGLGPNLAERKRANELGEDSSDTKSTSGLSDMSSKREATNVSRQPRTNHASESSTVDTRAENRAAEKVQFEKKPVEKRGDIQKSGQGDMDGAFDDDCRPQPKGRKRGDEEKEQPKKAKKPKKEQPAEGKQSTSTQTSANVHSTSSAPTKVTKAAPTGRDAATENMAQSNQGKVIGAAEKKQQNPNLRIHGRTYEVENLPVKYDVDSDDEIPRYKKMAMAMMQPDYNDHVHTLARKRKPQPTRIPLTMSGALMKNPETDYFDPRALPTPPASDEADNANGQASKKKRAAFKKRRVSPAATEQRANIKQRRNNNQHKPRSVASAP